MVNFDAERADFGGTIRAEAFDASGLVNLKVRLNASASSNVDNPFYLGSSVLEEQLLRSLESSETEFFGEGQLRVAGIPVLQVSGSGSTFGRNVAASGTFSSPIALGTWRYSSSTGFGISGHAWGPTNLAVRGLEFGGRDAGPVFEPGLGGLGVGYSYFRYSPEGRSSLV
jgi:hypothetical protein